MLVKVIDTCISCGICVDTCPDVFEMGEDIAVALVEKVPSTLKDLVEQAAYDCPVDAIIIEKEEE